MEANEKQIAGATIKFEGLTKKFGDVTAVDHFSFEISKGEFITMLGPSGSGKTTILNMVAGFLEPTDGKILINDQPIEGVPPFKRNIGMVFQNYALFPHMTVFDNIAFPLVTRKLSKSEITRRVRDVLQLVKLEPQNDRYPKQLSGGQQQRIALARAIVFEPPALLMDEPLGALDKNLREHMQLEIKSLHEELGLTVIYVTHDQSEALTMSDRIVLLNNGKIEQVGPPGVLYDKPGNKFVANFIGETNLFEGRIIKKKGEAIYVQTKKGLKIKTLCTSDLEGSRIGISLRPEKIHFVSEENNKTNVFNGILEDIIYIGEITKYKISLEGHGESIFLKLQNRTGIAKLSTGEIVKVGWDPDDMTTFPS